MNSKLTPEKKLAFLAVLSETCLVGRACKAIGISRQTAHNWREADPEFAEAWLKAARVGASVLDDELIRRALVGQEEKTYVDGVLVKVVRKSDLKTLLAAARAHNPQKYNPSPQPPEPLVIEVVTGISRAKKKDAIRAEETAKASNVDLDDLC
jgi:hypothetical protein